MNCRVKSGYRFFFLFCACFLYPPVAVSDAPDSYDEIAAHTFWKELYPGGGWSLYCGFKFNGTQRTAAGRAIDIEHIFSTRHMALHADCQTRMQCRESNNRTFMRMEADLHNMYPVWQAVITHRYDLMFGLVKGEYWRFDDCDIEWKTGIFEPRDIARGNVARAMLYMHARYRVPVDKNALALYRVWNRIDPPSKQEKARNNVIERVQGDRNPFIDRPALADTAKFILQGS